MNHKAEHLHFLGIAGHAMRGVAWAAAGLGYQVSGTDENAYEPGVTWLNQHGIRWWREPDAAHLEGISRLIISGHIPTDHAELVAAQAQGIPIWSYPELIDHLTKGERRIVVAGTHGKTTTTALITWILESAGRKPDFLIGIQPNNFASSVRLEHGSVVVVEGDEYRASQLDARSKFAFYHPDVLVLTSLELDHPDLFPDLESVTKRFKQLVSDMSGQRQIYYWGGSELVRSVVTTSQVQSASYDLEGADWEARKVKYLSEGLQFSLLNKGRVVAQLAVSLYGKHNVLNTIAASAAAMGEGVKPEELTTALRSFKGASRRFERVSQPGDPITVIDDYAHHPSEVKTTIEAVKLHFGGRVIAVFRPHTYSRTLTLLKEYQRAFEPADLAFIADIEGAREQHLAGKVSGEDIAKGVGSSASYEPDRTKLMDRMIEAARPGDTVLVMTVNGYGGLAQELSRRLNA